AWGLVLLAGVLLNQHVTRGIRIQRMLLKDQRDFERFLSSPALREIPFHRAQARRIVASVKNGKLRPDANGRISLPSSQVSTTIDGRVYVMRRQTGLLMVLFPTWQGKGFNLRGYLFCSRSLHQGDIHKDFYAQKYNAIDVAYQPFRKLIPG